MKHRLLTACVACAAVFFPASAWACRILLVNDDGVDSPGITALYDALKTDCEVVTAAPADNQSGASHAVPNIGAGIVVRRVKVGEDGEGYSVEGTPAEAAGLGIMALSGGVPFDLVIAGINRGENTGLANLYSGTVNAAMEALVRGAPAIAVSQDAAYGDDFAFSAALTRKLVDSVLNHGLPQGVILNVNIPVNPRGVVLVPSRGLSVGIDGFDASEQEDGAMLYTPRFAAVNGLPDGDVKAYLDGYVSIAPLALDRTSNDSFSELGWIGDVEF